ncbi:MAG TPA: hypothetical protein VFC10_15955 [Terriglobia bacterium]|jgi:hypothetical protein|nr:hypothetical protein [Terriglobia bacterium]
MDNTPAQEQSKNRNIVVLRRHSHNRYTRVIYQADLEELLLLSREFSEARDRWCRKKSEIIAALKAGASVERGLHVARLESYFRSGYDVVPQTCIRLVVR